MATSMDKGVKAAIIQGLIVKLSFVSLYDYSYEALYTRNPTVVVWALKLLVLGLERGEPTPAMTTRFRG